MFCVFPITHPPRSVDSVHDVALMWLLCLSLKTILARVVTHSSRILFVRRFVRKMKENGMLFFSCLKMSVNLDKRLKYDRDQRDGKRSCYLKGKKSFSLGEVPLLSHVPLL